MQQPTLLLIAKHPQFTYLIHRYGEQAGCHIVSVSAAEDVLARLHEERPAMVLLHLTGWPHQGWPLMEQIRAHCELCQIPITVISSLVDEARARAEGASYWLWQPVMYADFFATLISGGVLPSDSSPISAWAATGGMRT